jgi:hypothetical protein
VKLAALYPSRVMSFSFVSPCGIFPPPKDLKLTRKRTVKKVVENKHDDDDEIYDDNGNLIQMRRTSHGLDTKLLVSLQ